MTETSCTRNGCPGEFDTEKRDRCPKCGKKHDADGMAADGSGATDTTRDGEDGAAVSVPTDAGEIHVHIHVHGGE